ncbi:MAG: methionyl-tRNA formyltransferase [Mastigocoleus sp.]
MKIVFFGTPEFAVPTLNNLLTQKDIEILATVTQPDKARGRGSKLIPSPVKKLAIANNLPVWQPARIKKDPATLGELKETEADVFIVVAYGQILSQEILDMPKLGCINVHGSLLPKYRGAAPIQWSICDGCPETGITTMLMDIGMDTGAMLLKDKMPIDILANAENVAQKLSELGADLLIETLLKLEKQEIEAIAQDDAQATYAPLIKKEDYRLDWSKSAWNLHNKVRGFYPNCNTTFRSEVIKVVATVPLGDDYWDDLPSELQKIRDKLPDIEQISGTCGEIVSIVKGKGAVVQTGDGLLLLHEVQLPGKRPQSGWDFVNGKRLNIGELLGI